MFPKCLCLCLCLDVDVDGDGNGGCVIKHSTQLQPYFAPCTQIWKYLTIYKLWDCKNQKAACISSEIENPPVQNNKQCKVLSKYFVLKI